MSKDIDGDRVYKMFYNEPVQMMIIYIIFTLLFTLVLIFVMNDMLISYGLSLWFFTKRKDTVQVPSHPSNYL